MNSPYQEPAWSFVFSDYEKIQKYVFYLLKVMFSVLYVASTPESDLILETTFELRSCKGKPISNKTQPINQ